MKDNLNITKEKLEEINSFIITARRFAGHMGVYRAEWDENKQDWVETESGCVIDYDWPWAGVPYSGADRINLPLMDSRYIELFPDSPENIVYLDDAISKAITDRPMMVYRGAKLEEEFRGIDSGEDTVYISPAFTSASLSREVATAYAKVDGSSLIGIQVPSGTGIGIFTGDSENQEYLIKRGTVFKLIKYDPDSEGTRAIIRIIG